MPAVTRISRTEPEARASAQIASNESGSRTSCTQRGTISGGTGDG